MDLPNCSVSLPGWQGCLCREFYPERETGAGAGWAKSPDLTSEDEGSAEDRACASWVVCRVMPEGPCNFEQGDCKDDHATCHFSPRRSAGGRRSKKRTDARKPGNIRACVDLMKRFSVLIV
jgi:hypothetical protein